VTTCVAVLGGSFDPVHNGHVALGRHFAQALQVDELRVIPAGSPWQKDGLAASAGQRAAMVQLAFASVPFPLVVDRQEIARSTATYTIDTLRALRATFGADQLQRLNTWRDWPQLFDYAHFCVAARPGYTLDGAGLPAEVAAAFAQRLGSLDKIRNTPHGLTYLAPDFAVDISATEIRAAIQRGASASALIPPVVLDYIEQHNLYRS
jgi:nicotinate-nucleotide adenylyltransferase